MRLETHSLSLLHQDIVMMSMTYGWLGQIIYESSHAADIPIWIQSMVDSLTPFPIALCLSQGR